MCSAAEGEELGPVVPLLQDRVGKIKPQRSERRVPDDAGADRHANGVGVDVLHATLADEGVGGTAERRGDGTVDFACSRRSGLSFVIPLRTRIEEYGAAEAGILGQEVERILELQTRSPVIG